MSVYIHGITTLVPKGSYSQDFLREFMVKHISDDRMTRLILHRIYSQSGIDKRHTVIEELENAPADRSFFDGTPEDLEMPGTKKRNELYIRNAKEMFPEMARNTVAASPGFEISDITHVITVSCTGFYAPGPDFDIVKSLGLPLSTERYHVGFMGCYAVFPALRMARAFCEANPDAVVLVASLELCTLHLQLTKEIDFLLSGSLFADGGGGVLMSSRPPEDPEHALLVSNLSSSLALEGEGDMAWIVGDQGFNIGLSPSIPELLKGNIVEAIEPILKEADLDKEDIDYWGIHPGGRAIVDKLQERLNIPDDKLEIPRNVLSNYGNMSSATILFVLKGIFDQKSTKQDESVYAMAFGPGLTIEGGLFIKNPTPVSHKSAHKVSAVKEHDYAKR